MKEFKIIEIPHIRHTVKFYDMSQLVGLEIKGSGYTAVQDENTTIVFFEDIQNTVRDIKLSAWIAHELVHVLQIICEKISARFENEQEHMAYIMHYLMTELQK